MHVLLQIQGSNPKSNTMSNPVHNDQLYLAERFLFIDMHTVHVAALAYHKINSYKLSIRNASFCNSRRELEEMVKRTLLNYISTTDVLWEEGFFMSEIEN